MERDRDEKVRHSFIRSFIYSEHPMNGWQRCTTFEMSCAKTNYIHTRNERDFWCRILLIRYRERSETHKHTHTVTHSLTSNVSLFIFGR